MNAIAQAKRIAPWLVILPLLGSCIDGDGEERLTGPSWNTPATLYVDVVALNPGERVNLDALVRHLGSNAYVTQEALDWETSNAEVVQCLGNGWIEAVHPGEAILTAGLGGGRSVEAMVVVRTDGRWVGY